MGWQIIKGELYQSYNYISMNWYKKAQVIDRELGDSYLPDEDEYAYMAGKDSNYLNLIKNKEWEKLDWNEEKKRNARHHKKMKDIIPLEEEIKVLNQKLEQIKKIAPDYYRKYYPGKYRNDAPPSDIIKKEIMNIERLIRRTDKKISTVMGR